jgi:aspartate/tyrosine/aromatic aminotransferase
MVYCRYLPIGGFKPFIDVTMKLAYGDNAEVLQNKQVAAVQALSGTGACRLMAEFQKRYMPKSRILIPKPTWSNHHKIWSDAGVAKNEYRYYKPDTRGLNFEGMMEDLQVHFNTLQHRAVQLTGKGSVRSRNSSLVFDVFIYVTPRCPCTLVMVHVRL